MLDWDLLPVLLKLHGFYVNALLKGFLLCLQQTERIQIKYVRTLEAIAILKVCLLLREEWPKFGNDEYDAFYFS